MSNIFRHRESIAEVTSNLRQLIWEQSCGRPPVTAVDSFDARTMILGIYSFYDHAKRDFDIKGFTSESAYLSALAASGAFGRVFLLQPHLSEIRHLVHNQFDLRGIVASGHLTESERILRRTPDLREVRTIAEDARDPEEMQAGLLRAMQNGRTAAHSFTFLELTHSFWKQRLFRLLEVGCLDLLLASEIDTIGAIRSKEFQILQKYYNLTWRPSPQDRASNFNDAAAMASLILHVAKFNAGADIPVVYFHTSNHPLVASTKAALEASNLGTVDSNLCYRWDGGEISAIPSPSYLHFKACLAHFFSDIDGFETREGEPPSSLRDQIEILSGALAIIEGTLPLSHGGPPRESEKLAELLGEMKGFAFISNTLTNSIKAQVHERRGKGGRKTFELLLPLPQEDDFDDFLISFEDKARMGLANTYDVFSKLPQLDRQLHRSRNSVARLQDESTESYGSGYSQAQRLQHLFPTAGQLLWVQNQFEKLSLDGAENSTTHAEVIETFLDLCIDRYDERPLGYDEFIRFSGLMWLLDNRELDRIVTWLVAFEKQVDRKRFGILLQKIAFNWRCSSIVSDGDARDSIAELQRLYLEGTGAERAKLAVALAFCKYRQARKLTGSGLEYVPELIEESVQLAAEAEHILMANPSERLYTLNQQLFYRCQPYIRAYEVDLRLTLPSADREWLRRKYSLVQQLQGDLHVENALYDDTRARALFCLGVTEESPRVAQSRLEEALDLAKRAKQTGAVNFQPEERKLIFLVEEALR